MKEYLKRPYIIISTILITTLLTAVLSAQPSTATVPEPEHVEAKMSTGYSTVQPTKKSSAMMGFMSSSSSAQRVLVVPNSETNREQIPDLVEDMTIMCHIIDKKFDQADLSDPAPDIVTVLVGGNKRSLERIINKNTRLTEGLYVHGYGPLFLVNVGFPLSAPSESSKRISSEKQADPLWLQTQKELSAPDEFTIYKQPQSAPVFSPKKVEKLKQTLIETFKHASNFRHISPDQWITILVRGPENVAISENDNDQEKDTNDATTTKTDVTAWTLRSKKSDIDNYAQGKLDYSEFKETVNTVIY